MSYRPITDVWILARPMVKYYGAYPSGFLTRARDLLSVTINDPLLHVCSGAVTQYKLGGLGRHDKTLDIDPTLRPDYVQDCRSAWPLGAKNEGWRAILADPPYTEADAEHYVSGSGTFPQAGELVKLAYEALQPGGKFGLLHYLWPKPPDGMRSVAAIPVLVGFNNRVRIFSVYEKRR